MEWGKFGHFFILTGGGKWEAEPLMGGAKFKPLHKVWRNNLLSARSADCMQNVKEQKRAILIS